MASAKSILERMIAAMNRGETAGQRDIDVFAKPHPKKKRVVSIAKSALKLIGRDAGPGSIQIRNA
jgi:hypothetical protein